MRTLPAMQRYVSHCHQADMGHGGRQILPRSDSARTGPDMSRLPDKPSMLWWGAEAKRTSFIDVR